MDDEEEDRELAWAGASSNTRLDSFESSNMDLIESTSLRIASKMGFLFKARVSSSVMGRYGTCLGERKAKWS
jgi:hypothetical protein